MGRVGHKDDCQCAVCKRMAAQVEPEVELAPPGVTLGSIDAGKKFMVPEGESISTYIKYGTADGMVTVEGVPSEEIRLLPEGTIVEVV